MGLRRRGRGEQRGNPTPGRQEDAGRAPGEGSPLLMTLVASRFVAGGGCRYSEQGWGLTPTQSPALGDPSEPQPPVLSHGGQAERAWQLPFDENGWCIPYWDPRR